MRQRSFISGTARFAAPFACFLCTIVLLDARSAAAQALLYDNTDHLWDGTFSGTRHIIWTGPSTGDWFQAQPFKLGGHDNIASVSFPLARDVSAGATGTIRYSIWDDNGRGLPGQEVAELGVLDIDSLPRFDFPRNQANPGLGLVPNPLPLVTFDSPIDDLDPGETYYVLADFRGLGTYEFGDLLGGLSNDAAGTNLAGDNQVSIPFAAPPFTDNEWVSISNFFGAHQFGQMSVTSADDPYQTVICPVGTTYHEDFAVLGPGGQATTFMPRGWAFTDYSRNMDFDGRDLTEEERIMRTDTRIFDTSITDAFPVGASLGGGTPIFNAGAPGEADRALALGATRANEDRFLQLVVELAGGDANSVQIAFDIEAWDAANSRTNPGEAAFNVALDLDTGDGFEQAFDLGQFTTGATLEPPSEDLVDGNDDAYRMSFDTGLLGADIPEGSLLRVRWMPDLQANTRGWVFGLDNVSLGMFADEVMTLVGDYNGNGLVEQADLDLVLLNWGANADLVPGDWAMGVVDQQELDHVLLHWGEGAGPLGGSVAVPEPSGLLVALAVVAHSLVLLRNRVSVWRTTAS